MDDLLNRFMAKVAPQGDCWLWTGARDRHGYGHVSVKRRIRAAHRVAYELYIAEIPDGLEIDHLCRNRACVNPWHLEPVTKRENMLRGLIGWTTTGLCHAQLHEISSPDAYTTDRLGRHSCRACATRRYQERAQLCIQARELLGLSATEYRERYGQAPSVAKALIAELRNGAHNRIDIDQEDQ